MRLVEPARGFGAAARLAVSLLPFVDAGEQAGEVRIEVTCPVAASCAPSHGTVRRRHRRVAGAPPASRLGASQNRPPPPLRGDNRRLPVVVGWRRCRLWLRRAFSHDRRPLQRHRLPLPWRALVAVGRGDDAAGVAVPMRAGRRWPGVLATGVPSRGRGVPASPQRCDGRDRSGEKSGVRPSG